MKWAKPISELPFNRSLSEGTNENQELGFEDFNAPLPEQHCSRGGTITLTSIRAEAELDLLDVELAEERLADPDDKIIPFAPR